MTRGWRIIGRVRGNVMFPDHPTHKGHLGLEGGEDIYAERDTFRSVGEAMTWCRSVLDGFSHPRRWEAHGELLEPHSPPRWDEGWVLAVPARGSVDAGEQKWVTYGRDWREEDDAGRHVGPVVRTDKRPGASLETIEPKESYL